MSIEIDLQYATKREFPFEEEELIAWIKAPLIEAHKSGELTVRLVSQEEIQQLNKTYRHKDAPTNILSFVSEVPSYVELPLPFLGDIFVCPDIIEAESLQYKKNLKHHWAHIVIHGVLHLLGYDHINEDDFVIMKSKEISILKMFNIEDPYLNWEGEFE